MKSKPNSEDLLRDLLHGEISEESLASLASLAEGDAKLAIQIGEELEFSEMIRQTLRSDREESVEMFEQAKQAHSLSLDELFTKACEGRISAPECDQLVKALWEAPEKIGLLRRRLAEEEWFHEALSEAKEDEAFIEALETRMRAEVRTDPIVKNSQSPSVASKPDSEDLLQDLLHGDATEESLKSLASLAEDDAGFAAQIGEELEFSEMIRQTLRSDREESVEMFEQAKQAHSLSLDELFTKACEGKISVPECDQLVKALWAAPEKIGQLRSRLAEEEWFYEALSEAKGDDAFMEALETRMWAEVRTDHFVEDFSHRLDREIAAEAAADPDNVIPMPVSWGRTVAQMGAVAAAVAVGAFVLVQQITDRLSTEKTVATVVKSSADAQWTGGIAPDLDGKVTSGQYQLESGVVSLKFASGGEMTVEGPALFDVADDESAFFHTGLAMVKSPTADSGITLRSKGLTISEPVPLIGIDARSEFSSEAVAFSGDGGVCLTEGGCRSLYEMEAVKADMTRSKLVDIPYNPQPFAKTWELLSGVEKNMGSVRIEMPGTEIQPTTESGEVQVFVENESFHPETDMDVDQIRVGQFADAESNPGQVLQAKGDLRSYLLQLWPSEGGEEGEVEASLTFDHPVVGVIFSSDRLTSSDQSVGTSISHVGEKFNDDRGLDSGSDQFLLSSDRKTLNLKLHGGDLEVDQIRVLVALN